MVSTRSFSTVVPSPTEILSASSPSRYLPAYFRRRLVTAAFTFILQLEVFLYSLTCHHFIEMAQKNKIVRILVNRFLVMDLMLTLVLVLFYCFCVFRNVRGVALLVFFFNFFLLQNTILCMIPLCYTFCLLYYFFCC